MLIWPQEWEDSSHKLTYNLRRRFRAALAYWTQYDYNSNSWGIDSWGYSGSYSMAGVEGTRAEVFCAVNLFNQPHIYRYGGYNGLCFSGETRNAKGENSAPG